MSNNDSGKWPDSPRLFPDLMMPTVLPDGNGGFTPCPELLTEEELILFLRIPRISTAKDYRNVIENLKRMHGLPRIHICSKVLYPAEAIREWVKKKTTYGK
ncbi:MAG: hypothetical protein ACYTEK_17000 [Planctomycetota bacterium]|jgi:hypothetical protein